MIFMAHKVHFRLATSGFRLTLLLCNAFNQFVLMIVKRGMRLGSVKEVNGLTDEELAKNQH